MPKKTIPYEIKMRAIGEVLAGVDRLTTVADRYDISPSHLSRQVSRIRRQHEYGKLYSQQQPDSEPPHKTQQESFQEILKEMKSISDQQQALCKKVENISARWLRTATGK